MMNIPQYRLLLLSRVSRVRLCTTPQMAAHQALPSLGFSRQEHVLSHVQVLETPWTVACQAPLSMGFPRDRKSTRLNSSHNA